MVLCHNRLYAKNAGGQIQNESVGFIYEREVWEIKEKVYFVAAVSVYFHCSGFRKLRGFKAGESRKL